MAVKRSLKLVGPWYRWQRQAAEDGLAPRDSRPVLQKYDRADMITGFLVDPQKSLVFTDDDWVYRASSTLPAGASYLERLAGAILERTDTRKLFLPTHRRFYLVVCQLSCDAPGLPDACRKRVGSAGFVLRRSRRMRIAVEREGSAQGADAIDALTLTRELAGKVRALRRVSAARTPRLFERRSSKRVRAAAETLARFEAARSEQMKVIAAEIAGLKARLVEYEEEGLQLTPRTVLEGWVPSEHDGIGSWQVVGEEPCELLERTYPLYPLVPDPTAADHSGEGATLYFGLVPTSSLDTDAWGAPQFDADHAYTLRCFVREARDDGCPGAVTWSRDTEAFRLAPQLDPVGTANRSITIQMPDMNLLKAHAAAAEGPPGGVRMVTPDDSMLAFELGEDGVPKSGTLGGGQICFFYIPLITIVARFVLSIFLPIVVIVFQLWWMLLLKLCILPSFSFTGALQAAASLEGSFDAGVQADVDIQVAALAALTGLDAGAGGDPLGTDALEEPDGNQIAAMAARHLAQIEAAKAQDEASGAGTLPEAEDAPRSLVSGLVYETRIYERPAVAEVIPAEVA